MKGNMKGKKKDRIFATKMKVRKFSFDKKVVNVFDDMVERSVPFYTEIERMVIELAVRFAQRGTDIYDLGCSTGTTILGMSEKIKTKNIKFIGVDNSIHMIERTRKRLKANDCRHRYELKQWDLNNELFLRNPSVVILVLTLQFIRPIRREVLIRQIYEKLSKNGCVIIVEKILSKDSVTNGLFRDFHFDYKKRRGYSELEIAQKREALENILIPYTLDENILLLRRNGFPIVETFFKWYNFAGLVAVKQ